MDIPVRAQDDGLASGALTTNMAKGGFFELVKMKKRKSN